MNPFQYLNLTCPVFCRLLEQSACIAAATLPADDLNSPETAILGRLARFADYLVVSISRIDETPLEGVWKVTFEGRVSKTPLAAVDTSGLLKTVGTYQTGQGSWSIAVRLVR